MWLSGEALDGAAEAVEVLDARGDEVLFVTNSSYPTRAQLTERLAAIGIDATDRVISSATATAALLEPGTSTLVIGGPGVVEAVADRAAARVEPGEPADAVLIGIDPGFGYDTLCAAMDAIGAGARFLATNRDVAFPTPEGLRPGCGALVAAVQAATGVTPAFGGKPEAPTQELVLDRLGPDGIVAGDRVDTDGLLAAGVGYRFALISSAVNRDGARVDERYDRLLDAVRALG